MWVIDKSIYIYICVCVCVWRKGALCVCLIKM
jgi:hypothetical protein